MDITFERQASLRVALLTAVFVNIAVLAASPAALAATLTVFVRTSDGKPMPGAVLAAHSLDSNARPPAAAHAAMSQAHLAFSPDLLVIPVGSAVDFPNDDSVSHQIYSFSPTKRFQLPLYRGKPYPPVRFDQPGVVTLGCNIHDAMLAYIVVTDAQFFGRTDASGSWSATSVPRGKYRIEVWHPRLRDVLGDLERELTIGDTDSAELTLQLAKPLRPAPVSGRPHSWDAY